MRYRAENHLGRKGRPDVLNAVLQNDPDGRNGFLILEARQVFGGGGGRAPDAWSQ
jgi:hypothetical protein